MNGTVRAHNTYLRKYNVRHNGSLPTHKEGEEHEEHRIRARRHRVRLRHASDPGAGGRRRRADCRPHGTSRAGEAGAVEHQHGERRQRRQGHSGEAEHLLRLRPGGDHRREPEADRSARGLPAHASGAQGRDRGQCRRARQRRVQRRPRAAARRRRLEDHGPARHPAGAHRDGELRQGEAEGRRPRRKLVVEDPTQLLRRVVAAVDNLPRSTAPTRAMQFNPVPGAFDGANFERYAPYVHVIEALDAHALVQGYARLYPLFQRAYEELGFPGKYFNDRLMEAIDDLVAAPELATPPNVLRSRVRYEFSDPDLETRSAGQKILLRMGPENAARVKDKLWQIRRELIAASSRRP